MWIPDINLRFQFVLCWQKGTEEVSVSASCVRLRHNHKATLFPLFVTHLNFLMSLTECGESKRLRDCVNFGR